MPAAHRAGRVTILVVVAALIAWAAWAGLVTAVFDWTTGQIVRVVTGIWRPLTGTGD